MVDSPYQLVQDFFHPLDKPPDMYTLSFWEVPLFARTSHVSHEKNRSPLLSMKYWLVNRDPYNELLYSPYAWVVFHPLYTQNNQGAFFHCSDGSVKMW